MAARKKRRKGRTGKFATGSCKTLPACRARIQKLKKSLAFSESLREELEAIVRICNRK